MRRQHDLKSIVAISLGVLIISPIAGQTPSRSHTHITLADRPWTSSEQYPEAMRRVYRYKALVGGQREGVLPESDVLMGMMEFAPEAVYPPHRHPAPEIYYVMNGTAKVTVGDETFTATPGTAVYNPANTRHGLVNGNEVLRVVYVWWAPGGDRAAVRASSQLLEPVPVQSPRAVFRDQ